MRLYDITHPLGNSTAAWPGDTTYHYEPTWQMSQGSAVNLSKVTLGLHNGTHTDAPYHYDDQGLRMDQVPVDRYIGPARVVALEGRPVLTETEMQSLDLNGVERLLIRTGSCPDPTRFNEGFTYLEPAAIAYLAARGVRLVGTDAHSVDAFDSKDLPAHNACRLGGILILENLNLVGVPVGDYELIALPLKLVGTDGSPVRAVLRELAK